MVAASAFRDDVFLSELLASVQYGGFPIHEHGSLRFAVGNQVGDAVVLYALTLGPALAATRHPGAR